mgnify:CR=1 FL=1
MFLTHKILDLVVKTKDDAYALALSAFDASHHIALGAKESEIRALKNEVSGLTEQLKYERLKSDGLVDRLLVRDAKVAAVAPAAIELAKHKDAEGVKKLKEVFDQLNDIASDVPAPKEARVFDMAGGSALQGMR